MPHASGGPPVADYFMPPQATFAPREWGSTVEHGQSQGAGQVCPTRVGVHPHTRKRQDHQGSLPHASGGPPSWSANTSGLWRFAPREWGSTAYLSRDGSLVCVCPTRVGVHPSKKPYLCIHLGLPHASGGPPFMWEFEEVRREFAPREWGSTGLSAYGTDPQCVCPTRVGVHRFEVQHRRHCGSLPHASGGPPRRPAPQALG